jgi:hypothetical protein
MKAVQTAVINNAILTVLVEANEDSKAHATYFVDGNETPLEHIGIDVFVDVFKDMYDEICGKYDLIRWTV